MKEIKLLNEAETIEVGRKLGALLEKGSVITLEGDLGAGKTTFTKGLAQGLGVKRIVTSPTFTIIKEYSGRLKLNHIDAYRLEHSDEDIGFDEYLYSDAVTVVEWAQFISDYLPKELIEIEIKYDETGRLLKLNPTDQYKNIVETLIRGVESC